MTTARLTPLPALIGGLALLALAATLRPAHRPGRTASPGVPSSVAMSAGRVPSTHDADVRIILARPLFTPDRRAATVIAAAGPTGRPPRLEGTVLSGDGRRRALFAGEHGPIVLAEGERAGPFVLRRIARGRVIADAGAGPVTVTLAEAPHAVVSVASPMTKDPRLRTANNQDE